MELGNSQLGQFSSTTFQEKRTILDNHISGMW